MPIRFRCAYCNQLMGISKRKAGTVVKCPKCAGEIIVPTPDGEQPVEESGEPPAQEPEPAATDQPAAAGAFEEKDFEQYFHEAAGASPAAVAAPSETAAEPAPPPAEEPSPPDLPPPPPARRGLFLSLPMLFFSLVVIVVLLILMFVIGFYLGRHSAHATEIKSQESGLRPPKASPPPTNPDP